MKINKKDFETLIGIGCRKEDLQQIKRVAESNLVRFIKRDGTEISEKTALRRLGRENILSGLERATFHMDATIGDDYIVIVDAYRYYE